MFKNCKFISILVFIFLIPIKAIANEKIYFVDIDYILFNSIAGKKISTHIQNENKKINSELKEYNSSINKKKGELINQKNVLSKDEFNNSGRLQWVHSSTFSKDIVLLHFTHSKELKAKIQT